MGRATEALMAVKTRKSSNSPAAGAGKPPQTAAPPQPQTGASLISFTLEPASGKIREVEIVDPEGARHRLTRQERASFINVDDEPTLEGILEQTFEAGIACVLGSEDDDSPESAEDAALRRLLLKPMIEKSIAKRLMRREILGRAIVRTLIRDSGGLGASS
jgi:hypothetical protein